MFFVSINRDYSVTFLKIKYIMRVGYFYSTWKLSSMEFSWTSLWVLLNNWKSPRTFSSLFPMFSFSFHRIALSLWRGGAVETGELTVWQFCRQHLFCSTSFVAARTSAHWPGCCELSLKIYSLFLTLVLHTYLYWNSTITIVVKRKPEFYTRKKLRRYIWETHQ